MKKIKIALVDDHKLFRKGLMSILQQIDDFEVLFDAVNGREFLDHPNLNDVEVVLLDIQMPELDGIATTKLLREKNEQIKIIILSMHDEDQFILHLMEIGANGYLLKDTDTDEVILAIRKVYDSGVYFSDFVSRAMLRKMNKKNTQTPNKIFNYKTDLSTRELEVLKHICEGLTTTEIGDTMCISPRTVEGHRLRIMEKLGVNNTAKLVAFAIKNDLVD
ncbi:response regulator transcription factor [Lacihabitans sp. CS3-21]|uniref:response regulator transcription factor n=1 Tax=Lacihabitans sp. CS3-21 TaxID=2487332 RepID=UPI0020CC105A|nr:response regulator transcription factor [Lacihabitans sp. CS3-21]MCP9747378.1 DNA-binding response regulator [Lacihabitans sp. CS3-21]